MDTSLEQSLSRINIQPVEGVALLRLINRMMPLAHRLYPLLAKYKNCDGLLAVPFGKYELLVPAAWLGAYAGDLIFEGVDTRPEFELLAPHLRKIGDAAIVDVGSSIGEYVLLFSQHCSARIIAYEPSPVSFAVLAKNVERNKLDKVDARHRACGNAAGTITLDMGVVSYIRHTAVLSTETKAGDEADLQAFKDLATDVMTQFRPVNVDLVTLDEDLKSVGKIGLLKIDVEGFEYQVLSGARKIIEEHRPLLLVELHPGQIEPQGNTIKDVCDLLRPHYKLEFWDAKYQKHPSRIGRLLQRYFPKHLYRFESEEEMLAAAYRPERPAHPQLIAYPL